MKFAGNLLKFKNDNETIERKPKNMFALRGMYTFQGRQPSAFRSIVYNRAIVYKRQNFRKVFVTWLSLTNVIKPRVSMKSR